MNNIQLGKFISLILRHKPETIGINLDEHGWANVQDLINGINNSGRTITFEQLEEIVQTNDKKRYSFNDDKTLIRANQGHSINVDVELKEAIPPKVLYHGTGEKYLESILKDGIKHKNRLNVHLSKDIETATKVGKRHGKPIILKIDTEAMLKDGIKFYLSENEVWLTSDIAPKYFEILEINKEKNIDEQEL